MTTNNDPREALAEERAFWQRTFASAGRTVVSMRPPSHSDQKSAIRSDHQNLWIDQLFKGPEPGPRADHKMVVLKNGVEIYEVPTSELVGDTVIGRHPDADVQLEAYRLGLFHVVIRQRDDRLFVEAIETEYGTLVDRKRIQAGKPIMLRNGSLVDIPGYQLRFELADALTDQDASFVEGEELAQIPSYFYTPPSPTVASPLLIDLIEDRSKIEIWSQGIAMLRVVDIIDETGDVKTFRLVGERPTLFSYRPGQFVTILLKIDGQDIERSYSISSSPSRPYVLELTVKRVPGGVVSNWLCDHVRLGQLLAIKGPAGRFSCFEHPWRKMLFIAAGSGIGPLMSMSRWVADTTADVDVKFLASFRSVPDIIFRRELEMMSARHSNFRVGVTVTGAGRHTDPWTGMSGRVNASMIEMLAPDLQQRHVFLCGPEPFANELRQILRNMGFDSANIHSESFGSGRVAQGIKGAGRSLQLQGTRHRVTFAKSGVTLETDENVTLLELAEAHGIEIDYACRTGNCGECEVRFSGAVSQKADYETARLRKDGGLAFACCSVALSDLEVQA